MNAAPPFEKLRISETVNLPICAVDEFCQDSLKGKVRGDELISIYRVERLHDCADVAVPAPTVVLNFWPPEPEPILTVPISTGLAFAETRESALWRGLCEVAERDALMRTWWLRRQVPEIITDSSANFPLELSIRLRLLSDRGFETRLFSITDDFCVPGVFCVLLSPSYPFLSCGAAVRTNPAEACSKAIDEAVSLRAIAPGWRTQGRKEARSPSDVRGLEDHSLYYASGNHWEAFDFLLSTANRLTFTEFCEQEWWDEPSAMSDMRTLATRLHNMGLSVLWKVITADEFVSFGEVVKVIVPEMVPLSPDHNVSFLATPRLLRFSKIFNPYPHPFA
jgi:ribosomal protein S12 methylthiotransferase accessory factor